MAKIVAITVIIIVSIVGTSYFWLKGNKENPAAVSDASPTQSVAPSKQPQPGAPKIETITVTYSDEGFSPKEVIIARGSTVNFVNKSQIPLWVASDPHPEHTNYPEFDVAYGKDKYPSMGEDYSFTFDKVGTWKYHSHSASGDGGDAVVHPGTITVK